MKPFLTTERLVIYSPSPGDFSDQYRLQSDPEVVRYFAQGVKTPEQVQKLLNIMIQHFKKHGFSFGSVFEKASGNFVGRAGLIYLECNDDQPDIEIGYALMKEYWNKGFATELAKALIEWGFANLNVDRLVAVVRPNHHKSIRVLEKANMHYVKLALYNTMQVAFYEILKKT